MMRAILPSFALANLSVHSSYAFTEHESAALSQLEKIYTSRDINPPLSGSDLVEWFRYSNALISSTGVDAKCELLNPSKRKHASFGRPNEDVDVPAALRTQLASRFSVRIAKHVLVDACTVKHSMPLVRPVCWRNQVYCVLSACRSYIRHGTGTFLSISPNSSAAEFTERCSPATCGIMIAIL